MATQEFDVTVVGGGPGGYVAAIRATQLGFSTAVIEREHMGGICLNWGCIPTKALLRSSEVNYAINNLPAFGFEGAAARPNLARIVDRSRQVAGQLSRGVAQLMKKNKITVIDGHARLTGRGKLSVETGAGVEEITSKHIILATGARARTLPALDIDDHRVWTYKQAMVPDITPERLLVIGSGAIGMEFASFYGDMGSDVTVVEALPRILPVEDEEVSKTALRAFKKQGMKFHLDAMVTELVGRNDYVRANIQTKDGELRERFDRVIVAIGITGNIEDLGLEKLKVKTDRGHILTDKWGKTNVKGLYAIGDVAGAPWLAHKASHEGVVCIEKIAGLKGVHAMDKEAVPGCTYCRPQIASIGLTEQAAREAGIDVKIGKFPFVANGKALAYGESEGFVKTIFDAEKGVLLGAHMIGPEVTELIQGYAIARKLKATQKTLKEVIFPHPTLSESMHEAVLDAAGEVINI
jgi:dihydrolipoamide dehydrogenase